MGKPKRIPYLVWGKHKKTGLAVGEIARNKKSGKNKLAKYKKSRKFKDYNWYMRKHT